MRKSRKFDNVLNECLERLLVKGETIEQCLRDFPGHADALKPLLETALAAKQATAIQPRPEFKDRARYQFHLALQGMKPKRRRFFFDWQLRWVTIVAIVLALVLAGSGTVAAAGGSMPDEPLYPVKLAAEQVQLVLTPSALGKAELYAKLADKRVLEIVRMADKSKPEQIERTAQRLDVYLAKIIDLASGQKVTVTITVTPASGETPALREAAAPVAAPALEGEPALQEAAVEEEEGEEEEEEEPILPERTRGGREAKFKDKHWAKLKETVTRNAVNHPARLRALLETVPESARPALLRAIAISETGYEQALESLD